QQTPRPDSVIAGRVGSTIDLSSSTILRQKLRVEQPIPDATIYLAFDPAGNQPIKGFSATSDAAGSYRIQTDGIPSAEDPDGVYYLVAEKKGYSRLFKWIQLGPYSDIYNNTILLRRAEGLNGEK